MRFDYYELIFDESPITFHGSFRNWCHGWYWKCIVKRKSIKQSWSTHSIIGVETTITWKRAVRKPRDFFFFFWFLFLFSGQLFLFRANSHKRPVRSKQFNDLKNVFYQPLLRGSVRYKKVPLPTPRSTLTSFGFEFAVNMTKIYL